MPVGDIVSGYTFVPAEKNIDQTKLNAIAGQATIAPAFISGQTPASSTGSGAYFVFLQSTGTLAKILTQDLATSIGSSSGMTSAITAVRLRSFNAAGNPTFEVDQRQAFNGIANAPNGLTVDRWRIATAGTMKSNVQGFQGNASCFVPGTSYLISQGQLNIAVATTEPSLAAGDLYSSGQLIEGPFWRELAGDVTSISLMVQSNVAGLKFSVALRSSNAGVSLVKLCTIPSASTWTLIPLPNLPKPTSGSFPTTPGGIAYTLDICLACGTTYIAPAADTWQTGNFVGAPGMSNLFATSGGSFILGFIQHEPGPLCTTLIDKPFSQNLDECVRYFHKTYNYTDKPGAVTSAGVLGPVVLSAGTKAFGTFRFIKPMARIPTLTVYSWSTGAAGSLTDSNGTVHTGATCANISDSGFSDVNFATATAGACAAYVHY